MMRLLIIALCLIPTVAFAQLSPDAKKVQRAYQALKKNETLDVLVLNYIKAFPGTKDKFIAVFNPDDFKQLYNDSYDYLETFKNCATTHPKEAIHKALNIAKHLTWDADAISYLQKGIVDLANNNTSIFIDEIKLLKSNERLFLITFLADVENHHAFTEYQELIANLRKVGATQLAKQFTTARQKRMKYIHDPNE